MRIVVTGLSGNLGTALLRRLFSTGTHGRNGTNGTAAAPGERHEVVGISRRPPEGGEPYHLAEWVSLDLAGDDAQTRLWEAFRGADAVVHLAWDFQPSHDTDYLDRATVGGTRAVLAAADAAGVKHLVHMSSLGAYSPGPDPADPEATPGPRIDESWPTEGIDSLQYSKEKVAAERLLDEYEAAQATTRQATRERAGTPGAAVREPMVITRLRPALVVQADAGSAILRYGVPAYVPSSVLSLVKILPVDRRLVIQAVHADDVADAIVRVLERRAGGAFNLAAEPPLTREQIAEALGARAVHLPKVVLRTATMIGWRAHLQPLDPGWIDLAFAVPLLDTGRARRELGWSPTVSATDALAELIAGMRQGRGTSSPVLRARRLPAELGRLVTHGPVGNRREP
jgi:nucleoside-diphosphate-sugar epimerase